MEIDNMLMLVILMVNAKNTYVSRHSVRVAVYSGEIARRYGYTGIKHKSAVRAALLHDIGKVGIADNILDKSSGLTGTEFEIIKKHPLIGYDILKNIPEFSDVAWAVKYHHERYDGKGYPDGLRGNNIPDIARIITVADSYDAMTSTRSYRNILTQNEVKNEIYRGINSQFDPDFAEIMLDIIDNDLEYRLNDKFFEQMTVLRKLNNIL